MAGRKKIRGRPCFLGGPLNVPSLPTFCAKMRPQCCFVNGAHVRTRACTTRKVIPGIACCSKASNFWTASAKTTAFVFFRLAATSRLNSRDKFPQRMILSSYIDAIGKLDGTRCLLEWKTTSSRYPEQPDGLLALDPQLVCYSWMTGISEVAQVVFVRKRLVEIQYLRTTIGKEQREEFGQLVENTIRRIESAEFLPHSGIRFPQNPCSTCPYLGLCLGKQPLVDAALVRRPGAENLGWLDELTY